jgi:hypothetical protein
MRFQWNTFLTAVLASIVVYLVGVVWFFDPIAKADTTATPLVHPALSLLVYAVLTVALFDWTARQLRHAYKAAFIVAVAQFLLVNVDFVLTGKRGLATAGASTLLMVIAWTCVAFIYRHSVCSTTGDAALDIDADRPVSQNSG